jgi:hypothetical protein
MKPFLNLPSFRLLAMLARMILAAGLGLGLVSPVGAQSGGKTVLLGVEAAQFPEMRLYFHATGADGVFLPDLKPADVTVMENSQPLPLKKLELFEPGVQTIFVLNLSNAMAKKVGKDTIYDQITSAWRTWLDSRPETGPDDYTLVTNSGLQVSRGHEPRAASAALTGLKEDLTKVQPNMASLGQALDVATNPNPNPYMKRVIIYVTALPVQADAAIKNLSERASQVGVQVNLWLIGPAGSSSTPTGQLLAELAFSTGGQLFSFSGSETIPDLETSTFAPLRKLYRGEYQSSLHTSGEHRIRVVVSRGESKLESNPLLFKLRLSQPNPMFLAPPASIERLWKQPEGGGTAVLTPASIPIQMLVEFPDGIQRDLQRSQLLVDGSVVDEKTAPPFDHFIWPLESYQSSGRHQLQVKVEDRLGFAQTSIETLVDVHVQAQSQDTLLGTSSKQRLMVGGAILVALLVLVGIVVMTGRRKWHPWNRAQQKKLYKDPVSQPVSILQNQRKNAAAPSPAAAWPRTLNGILAPACMMRLNQDGEPEAGTAVPLNRTEITFGSDVQQAVVLVGDPSVEALHARLCRSEEGIFQLFDCGSTAGTWVNYLPVGEKGVKLSHGDRIYLGRAGFRFELSEPAALPSPRITPFTEELL